MNASAKQKTASQSKAVLQKKVKARKRARKTLNKAFVNLDHYQSPESMEISDAGGLPIINAASMALNKIINKKNLKMANPEAVRDLAHYAKALIDPESMMGIKVPDCYTIPTATYQSIYTYSTLGIGPDSVTPSNTGRFCVVVKPTLGTINPFQADQILSTVQVTNDNTTPWQTVFNSTNYVAIPDPNDSIMIPDVATGRTGLAMRARCVAASVWAEFQGSDLLNGGSIACAALPADSWAMSLAGSPGFSAGNLTYWENLAEVRSSYQGKLKDGCYVWWKPNSPFDISFFPVENAMPNRFKEQALPILVVSGIIPPAGTGGYGQPSSIRFRICIDYEYETQSRVVASENSPFIPGAVDVAELVLQHVPQAMANDKHESWIATVAKAAIGAAAGFVIGGPVGAAAGALGSIGVGALSK